MWIWQSWRDFPALMAQTLCASVSPSDVRGASRTQGGSERIHGVTRSHWKREKFPFPIVLVMGIALRSSWMGLGAAPGGVWALGAAGKGFPQQGGEENVGIARIR